MKANLNNEFSSLQRSIIDRLAQIEQSDQSQCDGCGGEDCICCEIYHDRKKWVSPEVLFSSFGD